MKCDDALISHLEKEEPTPSGGARKTSHGKKGQELSEEAKPGSSLQGDKWDSR